PAAQAGELPAVAFGASNPAVASITPADGVWAVTVAVTVSDQRAATARRFYQVPVTVTGGTVAALSLPTPVAGPTVAAGPGVDYPVQLASTGPVAVTVAQFLAAYSAGSGEVTRYVSPGVAISAITPAPYSSVQVTDLRCDSTVDSGEAAPEGQRLRLLATARASVTDTQATTVVYALTVTGRAGRWEVEAIDLTPARKPATGSATARQTPAAAPATGSSSSTHHNP
ncbi:MAG: conjugal transfer protein, partial [Dermatophilaceae bacterium]